MEMPFYLNDVEPFPMKSSLQNTLLKNDSYLMDVARAGYC